MKKILSVSIMLMLMVSISSLAIADEVEEEPVVDLTSEENETETSDGNETGIDDEIEEEIEIMNNTLGCEIRLLQLEKAITKNLLKGEMAVEVLKGMGYNTSDLEAILAEMRLLLVEVQAANGTDDDAVQQFIDLKIDARTLTKQFRDTVKDLLSDEKIKNIREQIRNMNSSDLENCTKNIRNRIKQFNRNQIHRLYGIIGSENNSLVNEYTNGTASVMQVKMQICKMINMRTKEQMENIFSTLKKAKINNKGNANTLAENATVGFNERKLERLQNRLEQANMGNDAKLKNHIQNRITTNNGNKNTDNGNSNTGNDVNNNGNGSNNNVNNNSGDNGHGKGK